MTCFYFNGKNKLLIDKQTDRKTDEKEGCQSENGIRIRTSDVINQTER